MGRQLAEHPCTFASTFESCSFHVKQSKQSARRRIVKTKVAKKTFRATVGPFILAERLRLRMPTAKGRIAVFPRGVLCTFWPQKVPKTPRRMPSPTSSRLTFETGARLKGGFKGRWAAERIISDTTLSLLKPASYAGARAFSRAFVSRLRHRAGTVRRGSVFSAGQRSEHANKGCSPLFACSHVRAEPDGEPDGERAEAASHNANPGS